MTGCGTANPAAPAVQATPTNVLATGASKTIRPKKAGSGRQRVTVLAVEKAAGPAPGKKLKAIAMQFRVEALDSKVAECAGLSALLLSKGNASAPLDDRDSPGPALSCFEIQKGESKTGWVYFAVPAPNSTGEAVWIPLGDNDLNRWSVVIP